MKLLFDASSMFNTLASRDPAPLIGQHALDFTRYELFNVIWKHHSLLKTYNEDTMNVLLSASIDVIAEMKLLTISGIEEETMNLAVAQSVSFYDSAYIATAKENKCKLVTEDRKMRETCMKLGIPVASIKEV
ncbi:MAG: type II toxin-antitoxin system VapC family toxin [Candidatus Bathyarchaeota archaeon]